MALINLKIEGLSGLQKMQAFLDSKTFEKAKAAGVRYAAKATPPAVAKSVTSRYNIKSARIKQDTKGPFIRNDEATLVFSRKPPTLLQYGFTPGRRGSVQKGLGQGLGWASPARPGKPASARLLKAGTRISYPNTFLAKGLPFTRTSRKLRVEHGPSTGSLFLGKSQFGNDIRAEVQIRMNEQFIKGMQRALDSAARGYGTRA
ncbi:hypothetical protein EBT31_05665 [bacterium]|nr:hypothetical protein [bacterium]